MLFLLHYSRRFENQKERKLEPAHILTDEEIFCLQGCRSYAQYYHMRQNFERQHCSFCQLDRSINRVLWEDEHVLAWEIPKNFQRSELEHQFMVVPVRHLRFPWELQKNELLSLSQAQIFLNEKYQFTGGMWFARFGDMRLNCGTVPHIHWNLWQPKGNAQVSIPVVKGSQARSENEVRANSFSARFERGETPT